MTARRLHTVPSCAFCGTNFTTATLAGGTPICWRPCYASLLKVQRGMRPTDALMEAFDELPLAPRERLMKFMAGRGFEPRSAAMRILEHVVAGHLNPGAARRVLAVAAGRDRRDHQPVDR